MPLGSTEYGGRLAGSVAVLAASDGCARHPLIRRLTAPTVAGRDLADAVHALCAVHGRLGGVFEQARRAAPAADDAWLAAAATAFADERAYLARLTAAVGPSPSTPGQRDADAAFAAQRHTFDMLARSDRSGCASGAALALAIDWHAFRRILDTAARRAGLSPAASTMPDESEAVDIAASIAASPEGSPAVLRAMAFGAQQTFAQHRGLCDLIEARAIARDHV